MTMFVTRMEIEQRTRFIDDCRDAEEVDILVMAGETIFVDNRPNLINLIDEKLKMRVVALDAHSFAAKAAAKHYMSDEYDMAMNKIRNANKHIRKLNTERVTNGSFQGRLIKENIPFAIMVFKKPNGDSFVRVDHYGRCTGDADRPSDVYYETQDPAGYEYWAEQFERFWDIKKYKK